MNKGSVKNLKKSNTKLDKERNFKIFKITLISIGIVAIAAIALGIFFFINESKYYTNPVAVVNGEPVTVEELGYFIGKVKEERLLDQKVLNVASDIQSEDSGNLEVEGKKVSEWIKEKALELAIQTKIEVAKAKEKNQGSLTDVGMVGISEDIRLKKIAGAGEVKEKEQFYKYRFGMSSEKSYEKVSIDFALAKKFRETMTDEIKVTDIEAREQYDSNRETYKNNGALQVKVIAFNLKDDKGERLSDDKIKEIDSTIEKVMERAKNGENYEKLVQEFSQDEEDKANEGLREYREFEEFSEIYTALRNMYTEEDKIRGPVESKDQKLIIKYIGNTEPENLTFEKAKPQATIDVREVKYENQLDNWIKESKIETEKYKSTFKKVKVYWVYKK